jgi:hypothetical protein
MKELTPWNYYEVVLMALTLWREARGESHETKIAVAHTVKNRVENFNSSGAGPSSNVACKISLRCRQWLRYSTPSSKGMASPDALSVVSLGMLTC